MVGIFVYSNKIGVQKSVLLGFTENSALKNATVKMAALVIPWQATVAVYKGLLDQRVL